MVELEPQIPGTISYLQDLRFLHLPGVGSLGVDDLEIFSSRLTDEFSSHKCMCQRTCVVGGPGSCLNIGEVCLVHPWIQNLLG